MSTQDPGGGRPRGGGGGGGCTQGWRSAPTPYGRRSPCLARPPCSCPFARPHTSPQGVVFFTYWQSIVLSILVAAGVLKGNDLMPAEEVWVAW